VILTVCADERSRHKPQVRVSGERESLLFAASDVGSRHHAAECRKANKAIEIRNNRWLGVRVCG
jgi:hypothetical protein